MENFRRKKGSSIDAVDPDLNLRAIESSDVCDPALNRGLLLDMESMEACEPDRSRTLAGDSNEPCDPDLSLSRAGDDPGEAR